MYKTFELLQKALYIIGFWSILFYILEVRKYQVSSVDVAVETLVGWSIFISIITLFLLFISNSYKQTKKNTKDKITKNVVEDGMVFTVGGHIKILPVLPEAYLIESEILNKYEQNNPNTEKSKREYIQTTGKLLKEILDTPEVSTFNFSEESLFKANEGGSEGFPDEDQSNSLNTTFNQTKEEIQKEANTGFKAIVGEFTDDHESRRIDKGILAYKYHFNLLFSQVVNYDLYHLQYRISKGLEVYSKEELEAKKKQLKEKALRIQNDVENTLSKILEVLPKFKYKGITTTTPQIPTKRELDLQDYQLVIFTALFPYIDWLSLRSSAALNSLDPEVKKSLSNEELNKLDNSELGLSLRDKRVLWTARRIYDIYINRDKDVIAHGKSVYNMPVTFDSNKKMSNPLEEPVALCELLRFSQTIRQVKIKNNQNPKKSPIYTENDIIRLVYTIFSEKNRFNTTSAFDRIGIIRNDQIYIDFDAFYPKFNGRFKEKYPHLANHLEYQKAFKVFYDKIKKMGLLAMRIRDDNADNAVETYSHKSDGELLQVMWEFKEKNTVTIDHTLIIHAAQMFKDLLSNHQDYHANAKILGVSQTKAIPLTNYAEKIKPLIEAAENEKRRIKEIMETVKREDQPSVTKNHSSIVSDMNKALAAQQKTANEPINQAKPQISSESHSKKDKSQIQQPEKIASLSPATVELNEADSDLLEQILEYSLSATEQDLGISNNALEQHTDEDAHDAFKYINREVQVVSLKKSDKQERAKNGGFRFAINEFHKHKLQLIHCSRDAINEAAVNLDFTILKVLDAARSKNYKTELLTHTTTSENILINKTKIFTLFNVIEQMALYQKKGNGSFWSVKQETCKIKGTNPKDQFNQISVIECLTIDQSKEEEIYQQIRKTMWNKDKAQSLFEEIEDRLNSIDNTTKAKLKILKDPSSELYLIPKQHLGHFRRTGVNINSFLSYCEQFKNELPDDLSPYAEKLTAIQLDGKSTIKFEKV
ncbi:hypothetical protein ACQWTT_001076 [Acinetobacter baumannii]